MYTDSIAKRYVTIISIMCVYAQFVIRKDIESKSSKNPLTLFLKLVKIWAKESHRTNSATGSPPQSTPNPITSAQYKNYSGTPTYPPHNATSAFSITIYQPPLILFQSSYHSESISYETHMILTHYDMSLGVRERGFGVLHCRYSTPRTQYSRAPHKVEYSQSSKTQNNKGWHHHVPPPTIHPNRRTIIDLQPLHNHPSNPAPNLQKSHTHPMPKLQRSPRNHISRRKLHHPRRIQNREKTHLPTHS